MNSKLWMLASFVHIISKYLCVFCMIHVSFWGGISNGCLIWSWHDVTPKKFQKGNLQHIFLVNSEIVKITQVENITREADQDLCPMV